MKKKDEKSLPRPFVTEKGASFPFPIFHQEVGLLPIFFSPTGTSRRYAQALAEALSDQVPISIDLTTDTPTLQKFDSQTLLIIAVPVYRGAPAPLALERLRCLAGQQTPAILLAVYGNRSAEQALPKLASALQEQGIYAVAAGLCVGEHSYHSDRYPIAAGRPDEQDLEQLRQWAQTLKPLVKKIEAGEEVPVLNTFPKTPTRLIEQLRFIWEVLSLRHRMKAASKATSGTSVSPTALTVPKGDEERCTHCALCVELCPTQAITIGSETQTDATRCIRCCACVKGCPQKARTFETPYAPILSRVCAGRKELTLS